MCPLRGGLKSLVQLLEGVADAPLTQQPDTPLPKLAQPTDFDKLYSLAFSTLKPVVVVRDFDELARARSRLSETSDQLPTRLVSFDTQSLLLLKSINLNDLAETFCPDGVDLKRGVTLGSCKRTTEDIDAHIMHQKRRKGQHSDIIQTGRSSKKFGRHNSPRFVSVVCLTSFLLVSVAPMRGRGFMIRQSSAAVATGGGMRVSGANPPVTAGGGGSLLGGPAGPILPGRSDIFRSRPQNTSRPPSLHVDDFNKLEKDESVGRNEVWARSLKRHP